MASTRHVLGSSGRQGLRFAEAPAPAQLQDRLADCAIPSLTRRRRSGLGAALWAHRDALRQALLTPTPSCASPVVALGYPPRERYDVMATHCPCCAASRTPCLAQRRRHRLQLPPLHAQSALRLATYKPKKAPDSGIQRSSTRSDARIMALPPSSTASRTQVRAPRVAQGGVAATGGRGRPACCKVPSVGVCAIDRGAASGVARAATTSLRGACLLVT